jgi:excisionase family DNA binding protein
VTESKIPLYVRLPQSAAAKLDRAAFELAASKQNLVAGLVARYVDPTSESGLEALREITGGAGTRRVTVETADDAITVGRHSFLPAEAPEVLTLDELATLLKVEPQVVAALAEERRLPGRRIGDEWRFARKAVLEWLAESEESDG